MNDSSTAGPFSYLALGDSYTIGESLPDSENYPHQVVRMLNSEGVNFDQPKVIAKTGWTTDELQSAIARSTLQKRYDFVTLLIGVNNQYRNSPLPGFNREFESLLKQAIGFAGGKRSHVMVLSIPDWSATPFAAGSLPDGMGRDEVKVHDQLEEYNAAAKLITGKYGIEFIDITPGTREVKTDSSLLAADGLHYSAVEYRRWAEQVAKRFKNKL